MKSILAAALVLAFSSPARADTAIAWETYGFNSAERVDIERVIGLFENALDDCQPLWNQVFRIRKETQADPNVLALTYLGTMTSCASGHIVAITPEVHVGTFYTLTREELRTILVHEFGHCFGWAKGVWEIQDDGLGGVQLPPLVDGDFYIGPALADFQAVYGPIPMEVGDGHIGIEFVSQIDDFHIMDWSFDVDAVIHADFWAVIEDNGWPVNWADAKTGVAHLVCPRRLRDPSVVTHFP